MSTQANTTDIELATNTLVFINGLKPSEIPQTLEPKMRDILANICDFQNRFARPITFLGKADMQESLDIVRPLEVLLRYGYAIKAPSGTVITSKEDGVTEGATTYCFAGKTTWRKLKEEGTVSDQNAVAPNVQTWDWLKALFELFDSTKDKNRCTARRLAACWYHIATQIDLEPQDSEEEADPMLGLEALGPLGQQLLQMIATGDMYGDEYQSDDDEDYSPAEGEFKVPAPKTESADKKRERNEESEARPSKRVKLSTNDLKAAPEFTPKEIQDAILKIVDNLKAYLPSPEHDMDWFKRSLKMMQGKTTVDETWFPWGLPPLKPYISCLESDDSGAVAHASGVLTVFKQHM